MINPQNTVIKLGRCPRCSGYVFAAEADGLKVAADPAPITQAEYVSTLVAGRRTFDLLEQAGKPHKLLTRTKHSSAPQFGPDGSQGPPEPRRRVILGEHGCGAHGMSAAQVEIIDNPPPSALAMNGTRKGGETTDARDMSPMERYLGAGSVTTVRSHAASVNPRHSKPRCGTCRAIINDGESFTGVHHQRWIWAEHERCP